MKTVVAVHTAMPMVEPTKELFAKHIPDVRLQHIVDDSLIQEVIRENRVTDNIRRRLINYYYAAVDAGADVIFNTCSSIGEVAISARGIIDIPIVKIDDTMAETAVELSNSIGVLATLPTTLKPTVKLINLFAHEKARPVNIVEGLAEGAFDALISGDRDKHDNILMETAKRVGNSVDTIVLAQGSMAKMEKEIAEKTGKTVFSSPVSGVLNVKEVLKEL